MSLGMFRRKDPDEIFRAATKPFPPRRDNRWKCDFSNFGAAGSELGPRRQFADETFSREFHDARRKVLFVPRSPHQEPKPWRWQSARDQQFAPYSRQAARAQITEGSRL